MKFKDHSFHPVVFGGDINAYSICRSFYEAYQVKSIMVNQAADSPIASSSFCETYSDIRHDEWAVLRETIHMLSEKYQNKKLLFFACGDWYVRILSARKKDLPENCIVPYIDIDLMERIVKKEKFYALCEELGLPYPKTFIYDMKERTALPEFTYPIVAKPSDSATYHYANFPGKKKAFILESKEELHRVLTNIHTSDYSDLLLIQDFIPGGDDRMRILTCYSDEEGNLLFAAFGHVLLEEHTPGAIGNPCCIINDKNREVIDQAAKFLKHLKYRGISNFDLKYDERDGKYKFFEINTRQGRSNYYVTGSGTNLMELFVKDFITNEEIPFRICEEEHLFTFVPPYVIKNYVADPDMRRKALDLKKQGKWSNPLFTPLEESLKMLIYSRIAYFNQIRKFKRYGKRAT